MHISLRTNRKIYKRQYRLNPEDTAEADRQISQMLKAGIIEESQDMEYNRLYILVAKKNGTKRLVVDLRAINEVVVPNLVQIPKIAHLMEEIISQKPTFLSSIDLFSGFWHVPIRQTARPVTSFTAPTGIHYQFTRTPFGLCNSPYGLSSALVGIFSDKQRFRNIYLYVDDILAIGSSWQEQLITLEVMLENLKSNDFTWNPEKCTFCYSELEYLGHRISAYSIRISKPPVEAVTKIQPPKNGKGLQRLLGLFNFFKRHIPKYAHETAHMRSLLAKNVPFFWSPQCQEELDYLKNQLASDPILKTIDPSKDFVIQTDGSSTGIGYVILQQSDDGILHPVSYGARALTGAQSRYNPAEIELMP